MRFSNTTNIGWLPTRSALAIILFVFTSACSEEVVETNKMVGTWIIDSKDMHANKKAFIQAAQGAEEITFTPKSAKSGSMEMDVTYEPTKNGYIVTFAGMKEGTEYKLIDDNTFEIYIPETGSFRYIRKIEQPK